jgi:hypothetical protein
VGLGSLGAGEKVGVLQVDIRAANVAADMSPDFSDERSVDRRTSGPATVYVQTIAGLN